MTELRYDDELIFCTLQSVNLDAEGNAHIVVSKKNKPYMNFIVRYLRNFVGCECSICFRGKKPISLENSK